MNPLGIRAMYLGSSAYRIHGTDAPWTIGQAVSHGCIRMTNEDVLDLYPRIPVGTRVTVTWQQFKTQTISDGGSLQRYTDKDSNPRAATAAPQPAASDTAPAASSSSNYSYSAYGSGRGQPNRSVASSSNGGGLESLFFWDQPKKQSVSEPDAAPQDQASQDATKDDSDLVTKPAEKKVATESEKKPAKKTREANSNSDEYWNEPAASKKKVSSTTPAKPKAAETASSRTPSDPDVSPAMMAVPDPVKPSPTATHESDAAPAATKASASGDDMVHVQKASMQVQ
jgi:hypothetical protein